MKQWIRRLLGLKRDYPPCIKRFGKDCLEARVHEYTRQCGHVGYFVVLYRQIEETDRWFDIGFLDEADVGLATLVLDDAERFITKLQDQNKVLVDLKE